MTVQPRPSDIQGQAPTARARLSPTRSDGVHAPTSNWRRVEQARYVSGKVSAANACGGARREPTRGSGARSLKSARTP